MSFKIRKNNLSDELIEELVFQEELNNIDLSEYVSKEELEGKGYLTEHQDLSEYATKEELNNIDLSEYATKEDLNDIGDINSLKTNNKTNIVNAINEVFQVGNNVKENLVDTLIAKGVSNISTRSSWDDIITAISSTLDKVQEIWYVEDVDEAQYNFNPTNNGYYESTNQDVDNSYSLCKLVIKNPTLKNVTMEYIQSSESDYDYAIISNLNETLSLDNIADESSLIDFKGVSSENVQSFSLGTVQGFFYIKYIKDISDGNGYDSFRFRIIIG